MSLLSLFFRGRYVNGRKRQRCTRDWDKRDEIIEIIEIMAYIYLIVVV